MGSNGEDEKVGSNGEVEEVGSNGEVEEVDSNSEDEKTGIRWAATNTLEESVAQRKS